MQVVLIVPIAKQENNTPNGLSKTNQILYIMAIMHNNITEDAKCIECELGLWMYGSHIGQRWENDLQTILV